MLHVTLILDLVTHCCVCLVSVDGMGGGRDVGGGFHFLPFGYGVEIFFCLNIFGLQILTLLKVFAWCLGFKSPFPLFLSLLLFLNHAYSYTYVFFVIPIILRV